jgi:hypothetical protein
MLRQKKTKKKEKNMKEKKTKWVRNLKSEDILIKEWVKSQQLDDIAWLSTIDTVKVNNGWHIIPLAKDAIGYKIVDQSKATRIAIISNDDVWGLRLPPKKMSEQRLSFGDRIVEACIPYSFTGCIYSGLEQAMDGITVDHNCNNQTDTYFLDDTYIVDDTWVLPLDTYSPADEESEYGYWSYAIIPAISHGQAGFILESDWRPATGYISSETKYVFVSLGEAIKSGMIPESDKQS